ncbi:putative baseplate assembly protein [Streptomyces sp. 5.8]|uniref:putative baseplate assembly protein n=1 Tax=Streptomyces sp. 5.8 TaxID=3406571 RepID=UPI003BB68F27
MSLDCGCRAACGCDPLEPAAPRVHNLPRRPALDWRIATHADSLGRMRAATAQTGYDGGDAVVALLDTWAYVADVVSFYTERIANEGFLRTAVELGSVRELARTLGHELRPGVAASADLAFTVEDTPGAPRHAVVPAGIPVQSVPAAGQLPQTFETSEELQARACWNAIPLVPSVPQVLAARTTDIWVRATGTGVRPGSGLLVVGRERFDKHGDEHWDFRIVESVAEEPDGHTGWTHLRVRPRLGNIDIPEPFVAEREVEVFTFDERANLFGWNAPDAGLLCRSDGTGPPGITGCGTKTVGWEYFGVLAPDSDPHVMGDIVIELDGDHPRLTGGDHKQVAEASWLVLAYEGMRELYRVVGVESGGDARYGVSGRITRAILDTSEGLSLFGRRTTLAHCVSRHLPAQSKPRTAEVKGSQLDLVRTDPLLPVGKTVIVTGHPNGSAPTGPSAVTAALELPPLRERAVVVSCLDKEVPAGVEPTMTVTLDRDLSQEFDPRSLRVLANVVTATHGETVTEVLGSGDGRVPFPRFRPRRTPLTHVRATNAVGARAALELRVDGVAWAETPSLDTATGTDRVHTLRSEEDGGVRLVLGDGTHGARLPSGVENVVATYRVGIGADGAAAAGQLTLLTQRPLGIRSVVNPTPARDWAPPENPADARRNAPLRVRTLDRAVSVADHEDFASGYAGVGKARADGIWEGTSTAVVVSVLGTGGSAPSTGLLADLRTALEAARDPGTRLEVLAGDLLWFGLGVELRHDPAYERATVEGSVRAALKGAYAPATRQFTEPVTAAGTLVTIRRTPGVVACTMPRLWRLPGNATVRASVLTAEPARREPAGAGLLPAQLLTLDPGAITIGVMP